MTDSFANARFSPWTTGSPHCQAEMGSTGNFGLVHDSPVSFSNWVRHHLHRGPTVASIHFLMEHCGKVAAYLQYCRCQMGTLELNSLMQRTLRSGCIHICPVKSNCRLFAQKVSLISRSEKTSLVCLKSLVSYASNGKKKSSKSVKSSFNAPKPRNLQWTLKIKIQLFKILDSFKAQCQTFLFQVVTFYFHVPFPTTSFNFLTSAVNEDNLIYIYFTFFFFWVSIKVESLDY